MNLTPQESSNRIFIYGSCVSRDIINFGGDGFVLVDYLARSSLASAFHPKQIEDKYSATLVSPFQRRLVAADLSKELKVILEKIEFDLLLIDFIDERFNLFLFDDGSICTLSNEILKTGFLDTGPAGQIINSGSDEFFTFWLNGWKLLVSELQINGLLDRVRVNPVLWASLTEDGNNFSPTYSQTKIDAANKTLNRLYSYVAADLGSHQFLQFSPTLFKGTNKHRWGLSPFHYVDEYYQTALRQLSFPRGTATREEGSNHQDSSELFFANVISKKSIQPITAQDYSVWRCQIHNAGSLSEFLEGLDFMDGIHRIPFEDTTLDILVQGLQNSSSRGKGVCLVGLGGALSNRVGTKPPYFSGRGVAAKLKLPLIAISDPSFSLSETLPLAWYAGNSKVPRLALTIAKILDSIADRYGLRLVLFGGSGGGFASLAQSCLLKCTSTAVVWNPQTSIGEYAPEVVLQYIKTAFPELSDEVAGALVLTSTERKQRIAELLQNTGVLHSLLNIPRSDNSKILYLQNRHDWHVGAHAKPYLGHKDWKRLGPTSFAQGSSMALHLGNWGAGHTAAPAELITRLVDDVACGLSVSEIATSLSAASNPEDYCQWFSADLSEINANNKPIFSCVEVSGQLRIKIETPFLPSDRQLEYAVYLLKNRERKKVLWYQTCPVFEIPLEGLDIDSIQVFVRDFWRELRIAYSRWPIPISNEHYTEK